MSNAISFKIPVITYHSVDESGSVISVDPDVFETQMRILAESGVKSYYVSELIDAINGKGSIEKNSVVITFDDGFENFLSTAFPVMEKYEKKATVFLVSGHCGKKNDWMGNPPEVTGNKLLSWNQIEDLHKHGVEFGAHSHTHPDLTKISPAEAETEIGRSKFMIEDKLGERVKSFAYPYGKLNASVRNLVAKDFDAACSTLLGKVDFRSDSYCLERVDSYYISNPRVFASLSTTVVDRYLGIRRLARAVKSRVYNT